MSELTNKLLEDIEKTGFPSELKVARTFLANGLQVGQNEHYIDYDDNKGREIDISGVQLGMSSAGETKYAVFDLIYAEVKRSLSKPWVIFTSEALWSDLTERCLSYGTTFHKRYTLTRQELFATHPAKRHARIGRTAYQAFRNKENIEPHIWVLGAVKASVYKRNAYARGEIPDPMGDPAAESDLPGFLSLTLTTPLVVLDGQLYEAYLSKAGPMQLQEQAHIVYSCHYGSPAYRERRYLVDIVTLDNLEGYLVERRAWLQRMADFMRDHPQIVSRVEDPQGSPNAS